MNRKQQTSSCNIPTRERHLQKIEQKHPLHLQNKNNLTWANQIKKL